MRTFSMHPLEAAIIFTVLLMGALGGFVLLPIVCINWTWNYLVAHYTVLPHIGVWQAVLLYLAGACTAYILGFVRIEIKAETSD